MRTAVSSKVLLFSLAVVCLLAATLGSRPAAADFPDVPPSHFAYADVNLLVSLGLVGGYWDGLYHPEYTVDRGQMAAYVGRTLRSRLVSAKPGYVQHLDASTGFVCAPVEPRATSYVLYTSTDNARTWSVDPASASPPGLFFGNQMVYWVVTPGNTSVTYYRPMAVVNSAEVPLCRPVGWTDWTMGDVTGGLVAGRGGDIGGLPWLCWAPYAYALDVPCVSFYVIYINGPAGTVYTAIVDAWTNKLLYGSDEGTPGVELAWVGAPVLVPADYTIAIRAVDFMGNAQGTWEDSFTINP